MASTVFINFRGGIIQPEILFNIMSAAQKIKVLYARFGLRQQLLIDMEAFNLQRFTAELDAMELKYEVDTDQYPNIISSYPAEDVFIQKSWLSESIYRKILDAIEYQPTVKVTLCDFNQSFTPMLTGNINWIADAGTPNYWHLFIRFPKTNVVYEWNQLTHSNDIPSLTQRIEETMLLNPEQYIDNPSANGEHLFADLKLEGLDIRPASGNAELPLFNLPYYEGLNRYNNKYWLGIYRRDEAFPIAFLKKLSKLCIETKSVQLCCTSWKTIMIKGIEEADKEKFNLLLEEFQINMRHAANELNFQVEDNSLEGLKLKHFLVKQLSIDDIRTFGICIGIKTRKKSEIFSSILVRKRYLIDLAGLKLFKVYDILCARDFNPNERTEEVFSSSNPKFVLAEQLRRSVLKYYQFKARKKA